MAMFSQNPLLNGPNYSFNDGPVSSAPEGARQHRFDPYGPRFPLMHMSRVSCLPE
jgi:hypothetical protein